MYHSRWKGSHYEAGYRHGNLLFKNGNHLKEFLNLSPAKKDYAKACIPLYQQWYPEIIEEIDGLATGQNIPFEDTAAFLFGIYSFTYENRCSCFAFADDSHMIFGRNSDFLVKIEKYYDSAYYRLDDSFAFIGNTTAMVEMEDGINEYGLAIGLTFVYPLKIKPGFNAGMLLRYLLEKCKTVREAIEVLRVIPIGSAQKFTLIDRGGEMAVIECNCEKMAIITPARGKNFVYSTNHFVTDEMLPFQYDGVDDIHSHDRYQTLKNAFEWNHEPSVDFAKDLLSGKYGFMCQYDRKEGFDTVWSSIYDLKENRVFRVEGNPARKGYMEDTRLQFRL